MTLKVRLALAAVIAVGIWNTGSAQMIKRLDALWARTVPAGTITIDGVMNEAAWAVAESVIVRYDPSNSTVIPGSGWKPERSGGSWDGNVSDPTNATVKFLVQGNELIVGVFARDSSVGGGFFNECDLLLMNLRDHSSGNSPAGPVEHGYGWVTESWGDPASGNPGASPIYFGPAKDDRTAWSGVTVVHGRSNDDKNGTAVLTPDVGYTMEVRLDLGLRGYDVTRPEGDIVEFTFSVYDADWQWPYNPNRFYGNRAWWQGQWGNSDTWNVGRIHANPNVTMTTDPLPVLGPDLVIPNGQNYAVPTIDGDLVEDVWQYAGQLRITYGDSLLRQSYPNNARWRSGQYQPKLSGATGTPPVFDSGDALFRYFFVGDTLFLSADVNDWFVTNTLDGDVDRRDGIRFTINSRDSVELIDHVLVCRLIDVRVGPTGLPVTSGFLPYLESVGKAQVAMKLKTGTTVNDPNDIDAGYRIEMKLALSGFGYAPGRGDGVLFLGALLFDHDAFANPADNYGTRTWFMREHDRASAPAWSYMDPTVLVGVAEEPVIALPETFAVTGNYPNPFNPSTTIAYALPRAGVVTLRVIDLLGRTVEQRALGRLPAGSHTVSFDARHLSSGVYLCQLQLSDEASGSVLRTQPHRIVLVK